MTTRITRTSGSRDGAAGDRPGRRLRGDAASSEAPTAAPGPARTEGQGRPARAEGPGRPVRGAAAAPAQPAARATAARPAVSGVKVAPLPLPRSRDGFLANICSVMQDLHELLAEENEALKRRDLALVGHLQERKDGLSKLYTECIVNLRRDPSLAAGVTEEDREALKAAGEILRLAVDENMSLLGAGITVVENVIRSVVDVAREAGTQDVQLYEARGTLSDGKRRPAMTINKNF